MILKLEQGYRQMDNDEVIKKYQQKQIKKWLIVLLYVIVIVLEILALCSKISMLWGCGLFIIVYIFEKIFLK